MKEVVLVIIIALGIAAIGASFAQNSIPISLEDLGLGEDFIKSPVSSYSVDVEITRVCQGASGCKTLVTACLFQSADSIPGPASIICKLTDGSGISDDGDPTNDTFGKVIAEGRVDLEGGYPANTEQRIPITQKAFPDSNKVSNVKDIKVVTIGPPVT